MGASMQGAAGAGEGEDRDQTGGEAAEDSGASDMASLSAPSGGSGQRPSQAGASQAPQFPNPFSSLSVQPTDPIMELNERVNAAKGQFNDVINLGIGACQDDFGRIPPMKTVVAVKETVEADRATLKLSGGYLPGLGHTKFLEQTAKLVFGDQLFQQISTEGRLSLCQAPGGTGAVRCATELLKEMGAETLARSNPTWGNHNNIAKRAGLAIDVYQYFDKASGRLDFEGMKRDLLALVPGTPVLLHPACHNPTGVDPTPEQWAELKDIFLNNGLIAFFDSAYLGFSKGIDLDAAPIRDFASAGIPTIAAISFSKIAAMYNERLGALFVVSPDGASTEAVSSTLKSVIARPMFSNCPMAPAETMARILEDPTLRASWLSELGEIRQKLSDARESLCDELDALGLNVAALRETSGMFSMLPLVKDEVRELCSPAHRVFLLDSGRINLAAINSSNVERIADSIILAKKS